MQCSSTKLGEKRENECTLLYALTLQHQLFPTHAQPGIRRARVKLRRLLASLFILVSWTPAATGGCTPVRMNMDEQIHFGYLFVWWGTLTIQFNFLPWLLPTIFFLIFYPLPLPIPPFPTFYLPHVLPSFFPHSDALDALRTQVSTSQAPLMHNTSTPSRPLQPYASCLLVEERPDFELRVCVKAWVRFAFNFRVERVFNSSFQLFFVCLLSFALSFFFSFNFVFSSFDF